MKETLVESQFLRYFFMTMTAMNTTLLLLLCLSTTSKVSFAWSQQQPQHQQQCPTRRNILESVFLTTTFIVGAVPPAFAAAPPSPKELERLQLGYARVQYLLQNWDSVTSVCGKGVMSDTERKQIIRTEGGGGGACEKTPLVVQEYMGYKSTEDPLYKADKLMVRAASLVDNAVLEDYLDVVEKYREKADNVAMMAYTSSWGEANPNGGKEVVDDYLDRTKLDVEASERLLKSVLGFLNLSVLPPSIGK